MKISKEGNVIIPVAAVILGLAAWGAAALTHWAVGPSFDSRLGLLDLFFFHPVDAFWGTAALVTWCFVIAFFRIPSRPLLADDGAIFAPCDGTVVVTEHVVETEVTNLRCIQVSIFMSMTNVHRNWFPVGGTVTYAKHHAGTHFVAWHPKSSDKNEHTTVAVLVAGGETVVFRQVAGMVARRIVSYAEKGAQTVQNTPCGFIKFGSRVDLLLPADAEILVALGQKVRGGQTPVARFARG